MKLAKILTSLWFWSRIINWVSSERCTKKWVINEILLCHKIFRWSIFYAHIEVIVFESLKENVNVPYSYQDFALPNFNVRMHKSYVRLIYLEWLHRFQFFHPPFPLEFLRFEATHLPTAYRSPRWPEWRALKCLWTTSLMPRSCSTEMIRRCYPRLEELVLEERT